MSAEELHRWLDRLADVAQADFEARSAVRDQVLQKSRELIRLCSTAIRAGHRNTWEEAYQLLTQADGVADEMRTMLEPHPDLFYAGYTQDALKEWVEARLTLILMKGEVLEAGELSVDLPLQRGVPYDTYLNGLCEAASELRRRCLDLMRQDQMAEAERLLGAMDAVYEILMSFSHPDAITGGLRRRVDQLRAVLERTRGDLTTSQQSERLLRALQQHEQ